MAGLTFKPGELIAESGQSLEDLKMIYSGSVKASFPGGSFVMKKGDVIGITDLASEVHTLSCIAIEETTVISYPFVSFKSLEDLLNGRPEIARIFLISAFRQISTLLSCCSKINVKISALSSQSKTDYENIKRIARANHISIDTIDMLEEYADEPIDDQADFWLCEYYQGLERIYRQEENKGILSEKNVLLGHLRKSSLDYRKTFMSCQELDEKSSTLQSLYFSEEGTDIFSIATKLYLSLTPQDSDKKASELIISDIINRFRKSAADISSFIAVRVNAFLYETKSLISQRVEASQISTSLPKELTSSLDRILNYSGMDEETITEMKTDFIAFKKLTDKSSSDDDTTQLRKKVSHHFNTLYKIIALGSLSKKEIPIIIRMFLYFGYLDEEMAGIDNTIKLYDFAEAMSSSRSSNVFTFFEWLKMVYRGEVMPSRDEFDADYTDMLRKRKLQGEIDEKGERLLLEDGYKKAEFEINSLLQTANKITFGRITTFCPIFLKENVMKSPEDSILTDEKINAALDKVRRIDPRAYYREGFERTRNELIAKEIFHREYLPNFILMPNVGIKGSLWQEIEGKTRNSSSRMVISVFHLENIFESVLRLTGEFRWEMTKRMQGSRWNDAGDHSLTSDYFNYLQFYKRNRELSAEAKERIKTSMLRAKNSYKEMFVRDYTSWIVYEAKGSAKLNRIAREIFFQYCTFSDSILQEIKQNPQYSELFAKYTVKQAAAIHKLDVIEQKLSSQGYPVPDIVKSERLYYENKSRC